MVVFIENLMTKFVHTNLSKILVQSLKWLSMVFIKTN